MSIDNLPIRELESSTRDDIKKKYIEIIDSINKNIKNSAGTYGSLDDGGISRNTSQRATFTTFTTQLFGDLLSNKEQNENGGALSYFVDLFKKIYNDNLGRELRIYDSNIDAETTLQINSTVLEKSKDEILKLVEMLYNESLEEDTIIDGNGYTAGVSFNFEFKSVADKIIFIKNFFDGIEKGVTSYEPGKVVNGLEKASIYLGISMDIIIGYLEEISKDTNFEYIVNYIVGGEFDKMIAKKMLEGEPNEGFDGGVGGLTNEEVAEVFNNTMIALLVTYIYKIPIAKYLDPIPKFLRWGDTNIHKKIGFERGLQMADRVRRIRERANKLGIELEPLDVKFSDFKEIENYYSKIEKILNDFENLGDKEKEKSKKSLEKIIKRMNNKYTPIFKSKLPLSPNKFRI